MLRKITVLLSALAMMMVMAVPSAMAHHEVGHDSNGNQIYDASDTNQGGGNDAPKKAKKDKGGEGPVE